MRRRDLLLGAVGALVVGRAGKPARRLVLADGSTVRLFVGGEEIRGLRSAADLDPVSFTATLHDGRTVEGSFVP